MADVYFIWKSVDSRQMGVVVDSPPAIPRAAERVQRFTIPGRSGELTVPDGDEPVWEPFLITVNCVYTRSADLHAVINWLRGDGWLILSTAPNRMIQARITNQIDFSYYLRARYGGGFAVVFRCQPLKAQYPVEEDIVITQSGATITNPGDVTAYPLVKLEASGTCDITIGGRTMQHRDMATGHWVDCAAEYDIGFDGQLQDLSYVDGDFWRIPPGESVITWTGSVERLTITPRWRWL